MKIRYKAPKNMAFTVYMSESAITGRTMPE